MPSILEFLGIPVPSQIQGKSFLPLVTGNKENIRDYAFSSRFPPGAGNASYTSAAGAIFDGWVGSDRNVEPSTVTDYEWAYLCAPQGMPSELYNLKIDPNQEDNVVDKHPQVAKKMRSAWLEFLENHGASQTRIRPFLDANVDIQTPASGKLYAFRDDMGQWIAFPTEQKARMSAYRTDAPGSKRAIEQVTFGALLSDNPKNLIHLYGQYYWAQDLA